MKKHIITLLGILLFFPIIAQDYNSSKGREEFIALGDRKYHQEHFPSAVTFYERALKLDKSDAAVLLKLAHSHQELGEMKKANEYYLAAEETGELLPDDFYLNYAETLLQSGDRDLALRYFEKFVELDSTHRQAKNRIKGLEIYDDFFLDTLSYAVSSLDINTSTSDVAPAYYHDDIIYLSSRSAQKGLFNKKDFRTGQGYFRPYSLYGDKESIPTVLKNSVGPYHQGPIVFFNNFQEAYSTENVPSGSDHVVRLKLFHMKWDSANAEGIPVKTELPFNVEGFSSGHPATNQHGSLIIFVSDMPNGFGGTDLYVSRCLDGKWTKPENLGETINTPGDEMFPYLTQSGQLYFASNGHAGLGGLDILRVNFEKRFPVVNPGAPLNSPFNDFGLIIDEETDQGYFSSNRHDGVGREDLYHFNIYHIDIAARMVDLETSEFIPGDFVVTNVRSGEEMTLLQKEGGVMFKGLRGQEYMIKAKPDQFNVVEHQFDLDQSVEAKHDVSISVDRTELVRPVHVQTRLVYPDLTPFEGEVLVAELGGRGPIPVDADGNNHSFDGFTKTDYTLTAFNENQGAFMVTFDTRQIESDQNTIVYEFVVDQGHGGGSTLHFDVDLRTSSPASGPVSMLTFDSGGLEKNHIKTDSGWVQYDPLLHESLPIGDRIRIGPLYFDTNQYELRAEVKKELDLFYRILSTGYLPHLLVSGYADIRGSKKENDQLSAERARSVKSYLVSLGYDKDNISTIGLGESNLSVKCDGDCISEGYQLNRRVIITFL